MSKHLTKSIETKFNENYLVFLYQVAELSSDAPKSHLHTLLKYTYGRWYSHLQENPRSHDAAEHFFDAIDENTHSLLCNATTLETARAFADACPHFFEEIFDIKTPLQTTLGEIMEELDTEGVLHLTHGLNSLYRVALLMKVFRLLPSIKSIVNTALDLHSEKKLSGGAILQKLKTQRSFRRALKKVLSSSESKMTMLTDILKRLLGTMSKSGNGLESKLSKLGGVLDAFNGDALEKKIQEHGNADELSRKCESMMGGVMDTLGIKESDIDGGDPMAALDKIMGRIGKDKKIAQKLKKVVKTEDMESFLNLFSDMKMT